MPHKMLGISLKGLYKTRTIFLATAVAVCVYFIARTLLLGYSSYTPVEKIVGVLLLLAETFLLLHALGYARHSLLSGRIEKQVFPTFAEMKDYPAVAVVTAARHEPKELLRETLETLRALRYPNKKFICSTIPPTPFFSARLTNWARNWALRCTGVPAVMARRPA